ncbi:MAG: class I SAM-dependent methyltransferase [Candidatus Aenigmatarchaeota archaeon]|nr:MAG: class I SAM-dependent methyltransferase [Candidatus Aenigmarchaeota archaeon]
MDKHKRIRELILKEFSNQKVQKAYERLTRKGLWKSEKKLFKKYFKKGSVVLDIGCGSGRTSFGLAKMGFKVTGIDITPAMIKTAKRLSKEFNIKIDFLIGDAVQLCFKNESFNCALFSFNGWDQIPGKENRLKALKEAYRVIRPGGFFIFTSHVRHLRGYFWLWVKQWIKFYILKRLGFNVKEIEFGDRLFKEASEEMYENEQFIHIPKLSKIKEQIREAGFELVFYDKRNTIAPEDKKLKSGNCTMFVCKKPGKS